MNKQFTDEQLRAYASQFRNGDAIRSGGKWHLAGASQDYNGQVIISGNEGGGTYINGGELNDFNGFMMGFTAVHAEPFKVTTLEDYRLQEDIKLVWLGDSDETRTFGESYRVMYSKNFGYHANAKRRVLFIHGPKSLWGVIPRYSQVFRPEDLPCSLRPSLQAKLDSFPTPEKYKRQALEKRMNDLINSYDYPVEVLTDVAKRLADLDTLEYHEQQVRYLENLVKFKVVGRKMSK